MTAAHATDLAMDVLSKVREGHCGLVLYGSRARGTSRMDSDVDVLQLVEKNPRSYAVGSINVTMYTPEHLMNMAVRGSLFVRHLVDEGIVLADPKNFVADTLASYRAPRNYERLKMELRLLLEAMSKSDAAPYRPLLDNLARFTVRSALYVRTAELGQPIFDLEIAAETANMPEIVPLIRGSLVEDLTALIDNGIQLTGMQLPDEVPRTFEGIAVWSIGRYPLTSTQLEYAIAGNAKIDYSLLSLPPS